jgi:ATP-dependent Clp protease, protease subunit
MRFLIVAEGREPGHSTQSEWTVPTRLPRRGPAPATPRVADPSSSPGWSLIADTEAGWLAERLVERRVLALAGELDLDAANRMVAELALLDASGDEPVTLRLSGLSPTWTAR